MNTFEMDMPLDQSALKTKFLFVLEVVQHKFHILLHDFVLFFHKLA